MRWANATRRVVVAAVALCAAATQAVPVSAQAAPTSAQAVPASARDRATGEEWVASWGTALQRPTKGTKDNGPNWSAGGFKDDTVRQVVRVSAAGSRARVRLSNLYGTKPLRITGAELGRSAGGAQVWPGSARALRFGGKAGVVIPPGGEAVSDAVAFATSPLEKLALTLRLKGASGPATFHRFTTATSYRAHGDHLSEGGGGAFGESTSSWYYLAGVEVASPAPAVVAFGDSLIDGVGIGQGADARIVDQMAERLVETGSQIGVVNAGIAGARLLNDSACFGDKAATRFRRDVLDRSGVKAVLIHLGGNDLGYPQLSGPCVMPNTKVTVRWLIEGHQALIKLAHAHGIKAVGVTILPLKGALFPFWTKEVEEARTALNQWIRTSGAYDAVLDADRALADPAVPGAPRPGYVFMDGLHPNEAGAHAVARAMDLRELVAGS
ncbi:GDSL-type esterase/lipase family protein [Streptosporangium sp. NPDC000396]|uniref:GDSL-type esterase/lipase family protein n=1 Tax=Streptosporangium sp. NPDC000396 TaxID=3366185 RepID=UPI00369BE95F